MRIERLRRESADRPARPRARDAISPVRCPRSFGLLGIDAADQFIEQAGRRRGARVLQIGFSREHAFVVAADGVERQRPGVALVRRGACRSADDGRLAFGAAIFDRADKRRHVRELRRSVRKRVTSTSGIHAVFQFAIELQEKFVVEEHRGIALLRAARPARRHGVSAANA